MKNNNSKKSAQIGNISSNKNTVSTSSNLARIQKIVSSHGKLSLDDQITYMKHKGITFNHITEDAAKDYLSQNTYYYKVTAFRKNIAKVNGKYTSLDFGLLSDLATIDMYLRYALIKINLDIEHTLKALLVSVITKSNAEDGYTIVKEYDTYCKNKLLENNPDFKEKYYTPVDKKIMNRNKSIDGYHYDLYTKRKNNPPIWVLIELMSFGELIRFVEFYYDSNKYNKKLFTSAFILLKYTKNLRDSAAHSRPLLLDVVLQNQISPTQSATQYAENAGVGKLERRKLVSNKKIHDFICMLILHDKYIKSDAMKSDRKKELTNIIKRCTKRSHYYKEQADLIKVHYILSKILANYHQEC
ncbi:Abi family protein [Listeria innocua]|uniref:Abi family protein n=1 Tax=Listeria innocua TaxID=1642 RepID=UPI001A989548|nr:Abi family protein [Listeria innocua]EAF5657989.1 Abi family protein [Listeria innocua]UPH51533.1 Abi family protein [Listeria innocua]UPH62667.1 Abi family protein [Listeria innocua]